MRRFLGLPQLFRMIILLRGIFVEKLVKILSGMFLSERTGDYVIAKVCQLGDSEHEQIPEHVKAKDQGLAQNQKSDKLIRGYQIYG